MGRTYDVELVERLQRDARLSIVDGVRVVDKPVPDDARNRVLDPRVLAYAKQKIVLASTRSAEDAGAVPLYRQRHHAGRTSSSLTETSVRFDECLIPVGDHQIILYRWTPEGFDAFARPATSALVYLHGGGFIKYDVRTFEHAMAFIAEQAGVPVFFPEYRLAPEAPFPAAVDDCVAAITYVVEHARDYGINPQCIMVAGDSAGGSLANACVQQLSVGSVACLFELYPLTDAAPEAPDWSYDRYPVIPEQRAAAKNRIDSIRNSMSGLSLYLQGVDPTDPLVSARYAKDLAAFPPVTLVASEYDYLRLSVEAFALHLAGAGVDVSLLRYHGCDHGFLELFGVRPQAEDVVLEMANLLRMMR